MGGGDAFVSIGWSSWNKKERLHVHVGDIDSSHHQSYIMFEASKNEAQSIKDAFHTFTQQEKEDYRHLSEVAVDCIRWLLRMGLAFRGHNESKDSKNREYLVDGLFGILVDESRDISIKEQMAIVIIYVDKKGFVTERFLGIIHVPDTTSLTLKTSIDFLLSENGLHVSRIRGQGYDGASNMQGEFNGLKTLILNENSSAFSIHFFAHQLQLTLVAIASKQGDIASFFSLVSRLLNIVGASCRRRDILRVKRADEVKENIYIGLFQSGRGFLQETGLQSPTDTRWNSHHKTLSNLLIMFSSLIDTLEYIDEEGIETEQRGEARIMMKLVKSFEFVFPLHIMLSLLGITNDLSLALQQKDQDIISALDLVKQLEYAYK